MMPGRIMHRSSSHRTIRRHTSRRPVELISPIRSIRIIRKRIHLRSGSRRIHSTGRRIGISVHRRSRRTCGCPRLTRIILRMRPGIIRIDIRRIRISRSIRRYRWSRRIRLSRRNSSIRPSICTGRPRSRRRIRNGLGNTIRRAIRRVSSRSSSRLISRSGSSRIRICIRCLSDGRNSEPGNEACNGSEAENSSA